MEKTTMPMRTTLDDWIDDKRVEELCTDEVLAKSRKAGRLQHLILTEDGEEALGGEDVGCPKIRLKVKEFTHEHDCFEPVINALNFRVDVDYSDFNALVQIVRVYAGHKDHPGGDEPGILLDARRRSDLDDLIRALLTARSIINRLDHEFDLGAKEVEDAQQQSELPRSNGSAQEGRLG
jgi:hypothetical protein